MAEDLRFQAAPQDKPRIENMRPSAEGLIPTTASVEDYDSSRITIQQTLTGKILSPFIGVLGRLFLGRPIGVAVGLVMGLAEIIMSPSVGEETTIS